jgi:hypothetical protein
MYLDSEIFYLKVLEDSLAQCDFEAVMSSQERLQGIFGLGDKWPQKNMSLEDNIESLKIHKQEFESREAFAYSVFNKSQTKCLGSVYIDPSQSPNYECEVYFWIRDDHLALDQMLYDTVYQWLFNEWPFSKIAFPGRCISWLQWRKELNNI